MFLNCISHTIPWLYISPVSWILFINCNFVLKNHCDCLSLICHILSTVLSQWYSMHFLTVFLNCVSQWYFSTVILNCASQHRSIWDCLSYKSPTYCVKSGAPWFHIPAPQGQQAGHTIDNCANLELNISTRSGQAHKNLCKFRQIDFPGTTGYDLGNCW